MSKLQVPLKSLALGISLIMAGCTHSVAPNAGHTSLWPTLGIDASVLASIDTSQINAVLLVNSARHWTPIRTIDGYPTAAAEALFTTDSDVVTVATLKVNGNSLTRPGSEVEYLKDDTTFLSGNSAVWAVTGYAGASFTDTSTLPSNTPLTNHSGLDTVSLSSGFTLDYSNSSSTSSLIATVQFDGGTSAHYLGSAYIDPPSSATNLYSNTVSDNGSVSFSSSDLTGFATGRYIDVSLTRFNYHVDSLSNGRKVGVLTTFTNVTPLYLKP